MHELPQTRDLAVFVTVVEDGGFAEAARRLGTAPSTLSRAVNRLEAQLGVTLLRRTTRSVDLTPEGRDLHASAREIVDRTEALRDIASQGRAPRGPLRVNAPVPFVLHVIAPNLVSFTEQYPEIDLSIDMTDNVVDLIGAHADVAIRLGRLEDSELIRRPLGEAKWHLVASPSYLDRLGWPEKPADLRMLKQVRFSNPAHINELKFAGEAEVIPVPPSITASNGEAVRQLVLGGLGIARFSDFMIARDILEGRLVELFPGQLATPPLQINAVYMTRTSGLRRLAVFLDWLRKITSQS